MTINAKEYFAWLANSIETYLNNADNNKDYVIEPQVGDYVYQPIQGKIRTKNKIKISGILKSRQDELIPINGYGLATVTSFLRIAAPMDLIDDIFTTVGEFVSDTNGTSGSYSVTENNTTIEYDVLFALNTPTVNNLNQRQGAGTSAEIELVITTVVAQAAVLGNSISIFIDDEKLEVLQGAIKTVKTYDSDNVGNDEFVENKPQSQVLSITAKVAYRKTTVLTSIVQNMLTGALDEYYEVSFTDGNAFTDSEPFTARMTVGDATLSFAPGEMCALDLVLYTLNMEQYSQPNSAPTH